LPVATPSAEPTTAKQPHGRAIAVDVDVWALVTCWPSGGEEIPSATRIPADTAMMFFGADPYIRMLLTRMLAEPRQLNPLISKIAALG
jgi:hypothetical protein